MSGLVHRQRSDALPPPPKDALAKVLKIEHLTVEWLAGDGSDRCYYRIYSPELSQPVVLMQLSEVDAIKLREDGYDWLKIARLLNNRKLRVPAPIVTMNDHAALIIEDYGDVMMESIVQKNLHDRTKINSLYGACFELIQKMISIPQDAQEVWCQRQFDHEKFSWELRFFKREYLDAALKLTWSEKNQSAFESEVESLAQFLAGFSHYFTHRDFHSRNIMVKDNELALIDFQDARLGSTSYDLVSLVFDNYVSFDLETRAQLLAKGCASLELALTKEEAKNLHDSCAGMILQRQLKAIGTYGFLTLNKKRGNYLKYVAPAVESLKLDMIQDSRWPFLSRELPRLLRENPPHVE